LNTSSNYLCPFCVSTWHCDGPHIEKKDFENFAKKLEYIREDLALLAKEMVNEYSSSSGLELSILEQAIYARLISRSMN
jgi:hypothetical protein